MDKVKGKKETTATKNFENLKPNRRVITDITDLKKLNLKLVKPRSNSVYVARTPKAQIRGQR